MKLSKYTALNYLALSVSGYLKKKKIIIEDNYTGTVCLQTAYKPEKTDKQPVIGICPTGAKQFISEPRLTYTRVSQKCHKSL